MHFLHCNSTYPTPFKDINLNYLTRLKEITKSWLDILVMKEELIFLGSCLSRSKVIEKHITLDKTLEGNDHKVSLTPNEFSKMVQNIRQIEESMGVMKPREILKENC